MEIRKKGMGGERERKREKQAKEPFSKNKSSRLHCVYYVIKLYKIFVYELSQQHNELRTIFSSSLYQMSNPSHGEDK